MKGATCHWTLEGTTASRVTGLLGYTLATDAWSELGGKYWWKRVAQYHGATWSDWSETATYDSLPTCKGEWTLW